ncbi:hypothetical protein ACTWPT_26665 [Nonomuraea sp. 3N208]|uniref:hypothetical protein n=1 Tax=Nonomuraea sp. 3N208 TaxID=3457421 RepID=UPI003FCF7E9B
MSLLRTQPDAKEFLVEKVLRHAPANGIYDNVLATLGEPGLERGEGQQGSRRGRLPKPRGDVHDRRHEEGLECRAQRLRRHGRPELQPGQASALGLEPPYAMVLTAEDPGEQDSGDRQCLLGDDAHLGPRVLNGGNDAALVHGHLRHVTDHPGLDLSRPRSGEEGQRQPLQVHVQAGPRLAGREKRHRLPPGKPT